MIDYLKDTKHSLFRYQHNDALNTISKLKEIRKTLFVAQTGYGKTYKFCTITKWYVENYKKKVLILCHREELCEQSIETLVKMGLTTELIVSSKKRLSHISDVYVGMEETIFNRIKKNKYFLKDVGLVIADECHLKNFNKHLDLFKEQKIIGYSATPVYTEKETFYKCNCCSTEYLDLTECCGQEVEEWSRPLTMSKFYEDVVVGAGVTELIEFGQIVKDINFTFDTDLSKLELNKDGEYTNKSLNDTYGNETAVFNVVANYEKICRGQRTIIFNPSSKVNLLVYEQFKEKGYNIKLYDSKNDLNGESRKTIVKWFKDTDDAILCNVNCFTTGFDCKEVQAVILNRATKSLALFQQMVGRGARSSDKIFKDSFIVIDGGQNIERFGIWSDPSRDWRKIFFNGIGSTKAKKEPIENVRECVNCSALTSRSNAECEICGYVEPKKEVEKKVIVSDEIAQPISTPQPPNAQKIIEFVKRKDGDMNLAFKIFIEQVVMLFRFHQVSRELYESTKRNGKFDKKIDTMARGFYFKAIASDLPQRKNVKLNTFLERVKENVAKLYQ